MKSVEPITPQEAAIGDRDFPWYVIQAFNELIRRDFKVKYNEAIVYQDKVIDRIMQLDHNITDRNKIITNGWLDIEDYYANYGWNVYYDKPAYNESGRAFFKFVPINME